MASVDTAYLGARMHATAEYLCSTHCFLSLCYTMDGMCPESACLLLAIAAIAMHTSCDKENIVYCCEGSQHGLQAA